MRNADDRRYKDPLQQWSDELTARKRLRKMAKDGMVTEEPVTVCKRFKIKPVQP